VAAAPPSGEPLSPLSAWAILALASHDAVFRLHLAGRLSDRDRSRARGRLGDPGLQQLVPRLRALSPPHGLRLEEHADRLELVSASDCTAVIERFLEKPVPEALTQAALEVLAIVAYEQPTRVLRRGRGVSNAGRLRRCRLARTARPQP
jgi:hypothetical protein